tara:strand:+ start:2753 stop:2941 length:189 start_codon:yes stop_codon:yes gene_type:complete
MNGVKMKSTICGEYPSGTHWTPGEVKEIDESMVKNAPQWLEAIPAKKKKAPAKGKDSKPAGA